MVTEVHGLTVRFWNVDFQELYARHLCRHSQFGNNVVHLLCLIGVYFGLYGLAYTLVPSPWIPVGIAVPYLLLLALNLPIRVWIATALFLTGFFAGFLTVPRIAFWWYLVAVVVFYKIQSWSHKVFTKESNMSEFDMKYVKGVPLFVLLSLYEMPMLLKYLLFGRRDWCA